MSDYLIVSTDSYFPEHKDGLNKISFNLLKHNPNFGYLCLYDNTNAHPPLPNPYQYLIKTKPSQSNGLAKKFKRLLSTSPVPELQREALHTLASHLNSNFNNFKGILLLGPQMAKLGPLLNQECLEKCTLSLVDSLPLYWQRRCRFVNQPVLKFLYFLEYIKSNLYEKKYANYFNKVHFVSDSDIYFSRKNINSECFFIPNGVNFPKIDTVTNRDPHKLLFVANYEYGPNKDAANFLITKLMPLMLKKAPQFKLTLIGKGLPLNLQKKITPNVTYKGFVEDLAQEYSQHSIFLSPLPYGSGIKNKVLEAIYFGLTVIGTPLSFDGISISDDNYFIKMDLLCHQKWMDQIVCTKTLGSKNFQADLAYHYNWRIIANRYIDIFN